MIKIYDTTLRDGSQAEGISFSVEDKILIAKALDKVGIHYLEGGWPGSNPKDIEFFNRIRKVKLKHIRVASFGSTRRKNIRAEDDPNLRELVKSKTPVTTIFGKTWDLHVRDALRVSLEENLDMIGDSVRFLKKHHEEVIYDAEHFFDAYYDNREYALDTLKAAEDGGADCLCLCDTNGGRLPTQILTAWLDVKKIIKTPLAIHTHNDSDLAVANALVAVKNGAVHVQGTINGYGERCGNVNLCSVIPNLMLKLNKKVIPKNNLKKLTWLSRYMNELANRSHNDKMPFVGMSAFAHKGGIHVDAVQKNTRTYEHIPPESVGNKRRILISDLSGKSNVLAKANDYGIKIKKDDPRVKTILNQIKEAEHLGYSYEAAEASFELLLKKAENKEKIYFQLLGFRIVNEKHSGKAGQYCEATIKVKVKNRVEHTAAEGDGPVNALDNALRKALYPFYPALKHTRLTDYKVRVLDEKAGTAAKVRVLINSSDGKDSWGTVGVSTNIVEASWQALVDSVNYALYRSSKKKI